MEFIILMGNVGTGKTTFAKEKYSENAILISIDDINDEFNGCIEQTQKEIIKRIDRGIERGETVVVDGLMLSEFIRSTYLGIAFRKNQNITSKIIDFGPGTDESLLRRSIDNHAKSFDEWKKIHEENMQYYERPSETEGFSEIIFMY